MLEFKPNAKYFVSDTILVTKIIERLKLVQAKHQKISIIMIK